MKNRIVFLLNMKKQQQRNQSSLLICCSTYIRPLGGAVTQQQTYTITEKKPRQRSVTQSRRSKQARCLCSQAGSGADPTGPRGPEAAHRVLWPLAAGPHVPSVLPRRATVRGRTLRSERSDGAHRDQRRAGAGSLPAAQERPRRVHQERLQDEGVTVY